MDPTPALRLALDPSGILEAQEITPDPWQRDLLASSGNQVLLNCSRQSEKAKVPGRDIARHRKCTAVWWRAATSGGSRNEAAA